jgi:hypothetical protein
MSRPNDANEQMPRREARRLIALATLAIAGCGAPDTPAEVPSAEPPTRVVTRQNAAESHPHQELPAAELPNAAAPSPMAESNLVDDDGKTLWDSPTHGRPLSVAYLPPGCQLILAMRPAELLERPEGERMVAALGPIGERAVRFVERTARIPLRDVERLMVGWQTTRDGAWDTTLVVTAKPATMTRAIDALRASAAPQERDGEKYLMADDRAYWQPKLADGRILVIASKAAMADIVDLGGSPPPLRRDIERLLSYTDSARQATLLVAPSYLFGEGAGLFSGEATQLRDPLFWFLGDDLSAAALSVDLGESCFVELVAVPTLDVPTNKVGNQLAQRLTKSPDRLASYIASLSPSEYGRTIVARFPEMVRALAKYTRHQADRDHVVLRCYLPAAAGQNLLIGAELTLAESSGGGKARSSVASESASPKSVRERLQQQTSLRFTKDTLEAALQMLADDVGVEIIIRGADLQLDGITKNQSFGIDLTDKPAEEILTQILRLANPDKAATGLSDPKQKLVYVVEPKSPGGPDVVFVTTRAAAKKRGETLPAVFTAK